MGGNNTCAWPEVEDEVGCHQAERGWKQRPAGRLQRELPRCVSGRTNRVPGPEPGGGSDKQIQSSLQNPGRQKSLIRKYPLLTIEGRSLTCQVQIFQKLLPLKV